VPGHGGHPPTPSSHRAPADGRSPAVPGRDDRRRRPARDPADPGGLGHPGAWPDDQHLRDNPHIRFFESRLRGYTRYTVIRDRWYADLRVVDTIERPGAPVRTLATYVVESGRPGAEQV
jgi:hypothetical protein